MKKGLLLIATFFNTGKFPIAPGTLASLVTVFILYLYHMYFESLFSIQVIAIAIVFFLGVPAAHHAEKFYKKKDPRPCVIDEVAGQMVSLLLIPHSIILYAAGFFLFRVFDIIKPFPIRKVEKIPGGLGVMLDDILAGLYTVGSLHLFLYITRA